jgi:DNA-directed RNA polymerase specialized sigma24 family protein
MITRPCCENEDTSLVRAIEQVRNGDSVAFEVIYNHCIGTVRRLCRCRLCWKDLCIQFDDDLASEIMTALWKSICDPKLEWETENRLWQAIYRLVFERCINRGKYNKQQKRRNDLELGLLFDALYGHRDWGIGMAEVDAEDLAQVLLEKLPDNESREFVVCKLRGLTNDQIAVQWQVTIRTIQRRMDAVRQHFDEKVSIRA